MLDEVAARIASDLDDHEAWMVLADGLLDRSDERGRWIRLHYDQDRQRIDERLILEARWHRGGPKGFEWPGARLSWRFGFVVRVDVHWDDRTLAQLQALDAHPDGLVWRSLALSEMPAKAVADLRSAAFANRLRTLTLASTHLGDNGLLSLARGKFPSLTKLDVQNNECTATGLAALVEAPFIGQLRTLRLRNNPLGPAGGMVLGTLKSPALQVLDLTRTELTDAGLEALGRGPLGASVSNLALAANQLTGAHLTKLTAARTVDLSHNEALSVDAVAAAACGWTSLVLDGCALVDSDVPALRAASALKALSLSRNPELSLARMGEADLPNSLQSLVLSGCAVATRGWLALAAASLPHLQQLRLNGCQLTGLGDVPPQAFPSLEALDIGANRLQDGGSALAHALPALRTLKARRCGIGEGLEDWRHAPWFEKLEELDLSGQTLPWSKLLAARRLVRLSLGRCRLSGTLRGLHDLPQLESLNLCHNHLSNAAPIVEAGHPNLRQLNLSSNGIDDAGAARLTNQLEYFPRLQRLNLRSNPLSSSMQAAFEQASTPTMLEVTGAGG